MSQRIAIVDYGMGNLRSVARALEQVAPEAAVLVSGEPDLIRSAYRVVLPGQGAMPDCMRHLRESGLVEAVLEVARSKPLLGVCIGEQMLFDWSEEGPTPGLGLLPGQVLRFRPADLQQADGTRLKVPHMGWNRVEPVREHPIWEGIAAGARFYFVHSYYAVPARGRQARTEPVWSELYLCGRAG